MSNQGLASSAKYKNPINYASSAKNDNEEKVDISDTRYYINEKGIVDQEKKREYLAAAALRKENKNQE